MSRTVIDDFDPDPSQLEFLSDLTSRFARQSAMGRRRTNNYWFQHGGGFERITASRAHRDWLNTDEGLDAFGQAVRDSEMPEDSARDLLYIAITEFDRRDEAWRASRMAHTSNTNNPIAEYYSTGHSTVNPARGPSPFPNSTATHTPSMFEQQQRNTAANNRYTNDANQDSQSDRENLEGTDAEPFRFSEAKSRWEEENGAIAIDRELDGFMDQR